MERYYGNNNIINFLCAAFRFLLKEGQHLVFVLIQREQRNQRHKFIADLSRKAEYPSISADYFYGTYLFRVLFVVNQELRMIYVILRNLICEIKSI